MACNRQITEKITLRTSRSAYYHIILNLSVIIMFFPISIGIE